MTIAIPALTTLDATEVQDNLTLATQQVNEVNPSLDLRLGALHDILLYFHAVLATALQQNINDYLAAQSLLALSQSTNPDLADPALVDNILSNFNITREPGTLTTGQVTIVVSNNTTVSIANGTTFTANGTAFVTTAAYIAKAETAQVISPTDRLLVPLNNGNYSFTIPVVATAAGALT